MAGTACHVFTSPTRVGLTPVFAGMTKIQLRWVTAAICAALCASAAAKELVVAGLSIDWPEGYERAADENPARISGPDGVTVLLTIWGPNGAEPAGGQQQRAFERLASDRMPELAAAAGKVVLPLREEQLANGQILLSTGSQSVEGGAKQFYLQYFLATSSGMASLVTIEGPGAALVQERRFRPLLASGTWKHAR